MHALWKNVWTAEEEASLSTLWEVRLRGVFWKGELLFQYLISVSFLLLHGILGADSAVFV